MFVHRPIVMTDAGVVASGHHKASEAGASVLREGGNAIDAAVAASAVLSVAIPHMNGLGGDCIALYREAPSGQTFAINGSGRAPRSASPDRIRAAGHERMPSRGPFTVSVCGLVDAWERSLARFGTRRLGSLLGPAAALARAGVPLDSVLRTYFAGADYARMADFSPGLAALYGAPAPRRLGERLENPVLADTIEEVAREGADGFYRGSIARRLLADLREAGVPLETEDFVSHRTGIGSPLSQEFCGGRLHVSPPNAQGIALAVMAGLCDLEREATGRLPSVAPSGFLARKRVAFARRGEIDDEAFTGDAAFALTREGLRSLPVSAPTRSDIGGAVGGDTSTLVVMDRWGNAVSWVQSLFEDFGSGVVSPSTGIVMQSRLSLQGLAAGDPWPLRPGGRPFHTLCPAILERHGRCEMAIATPGDHGQPQTIMQVLLRHLGEGLDVQAAIEAPRLRHDEGTAVMVEDRAPSQWREEIEAEGYAVESVGPWSRLMGGVNAIARHGEDPMMAGADPRRASYAVAAD